MIRANEGNAFVFLKTEEIELFASVYGMTVLGLQAHLIRVEVDVSNGLPSFDIVGPFSI